MLQPLYSLEISLLHFFLYEYVKCYFSKKICGWHWYPSCKDNWNNPKYGEGNIWLDVIRATEGSHVEAYQSTNRDFQLRNIMQKAACICSGYHVIKIY